MPSTVDEFAALVGADMKALRYDSGLRDITSLAGDKVVSGNIYLRRRGNLVTFRLHVVRPSTTWTTGTTVLTLPSGFRRPERWDGWITAQAQWSRSAFMFPTGGFGLYRPGYPTTNDPPDPADSYRAELTWITNDPIPVALPGTAV